MMTLDLEFWLMRRSREEFSFGNVYVSTVGRYQTVIHAKGFRGIPITNTVLRR